MKFNDTFNYSAVNLFILNYNLIHFLNSNFSPVQKRSIFPITLFWLTYQML